MEKNLEESLRVLLCELGDTIRDTVIAGRTAQTAEKLAQVAGESEADTIYEIDRLSEVAIQNWLAAHWPVQEPVELVMEGIDDSARPIFPSTVLEARWVLIVDPIDGTRGLMYDKRSAWALAGLAPKLGEATALSDLCVAAMTEIPTSKQWRADQISCVEGLGLHAESVDVRTGERQPLVLQPSQARDFRHGFSSLVKFFPEGRTLTSQIEEALWDELIGLASSPSPVIFDDQYISTGGQFYELLAGHDRMVGDLRPLIHARLELDTSLVCHPYDACTWLLLQEAGIIFEGPDGEFPDAPLDTTSPVTWLAFANTELASQARPVLRRLLHDILG